MYNYKSAEKFIIVNDDPDLSPIKILLPRPPKLSTIDGYGLAPREQFFHREKTPQKLIELQKQSSDADACIKTIRDNEEYYAEEIAFIQREWDRRINGYWFFNNGVPTYIPGVHYFYLNYWFIGSNHPEYRSRDRKFFIFAMFCLQDPYCAGFNYPKFRREGATQKASCFIYWLTSMERNAHSGIQSQDEPSAKSVFDIITSSHRKMPFWFAPITASRDTAASVLNFIAKGKTNSDGRIFNSTDSLESKIDYGSQTEGYYDRAKLRVHYADEIGKTTRASVYTRYLRIKPALTEGNKYIGISMSTSTVGEMTKGGGESFLTLCKESMYHQRNELGETNSGLYNLFIPAQDGFDLQDKATGKKFIDRHGNSNIEENEKYLLAVRKAKYESGDMAGYTEEIRQYPMSFRECFRTTPGECKFNVAILEYILEKYRFGNPHIVRGNFRWKGDIPDGTVEWYPCANGRFIASYIPSQAESNKFIMQGSIRVPACKHQFIAGGDPFKYNVTKGKKSEKSDGAGAIFRKYDVAIDHPDSPPENWKTDQFCITYSARPPKKVYGEDMLMMCIYYGCEMFPEINVDFLWDYFEERGYIGYLYYQIDKKTRRKSKTPGATTGVNTQESIFGEWEKYIDRNGRKDNEKHDELMYQCREIVDDMNPFDLFVAGGYALLGAKRQESVMQVVHKAPPFRRKYNYARSG